jgi:hypothetical protein
MRRGPPMQLVRFERAELHGFFNTPRYGFASVKCVVKRLHSNLWF